MAITEKDVEFVPGFISPLTDKEHARLGRIAVLWGQIEFFLDRILVLVSGLSQEELNSLQVMDKPMGAKANFLIVASDRLSDKASASDVRTFCAAISDTKVRRNHAIHGVWGLRIDDRTKTVEPCARKGSEPSTPLKLSHLAALEKQLCRASRLGYNLEHALSKRDRPKGRHNVFYHGKQARPPAWFSQWLERNRPDYAALCHSEGKGQLPRQDRLPSRK